MKGLMARLLKQIVNLKEDGETQGNQLKINQMDVEELSSKLKELLKDKRYTTIDY
jgi:hypothetical protein